MICVSRDLRSIYVACMLIAVGMALENEEEGSIQVKRKLETIDGVEIASSYKEYLDLALGDLEDRVGKNTLKLSDCKDRISKRKLLMEQIDQEIQKRHVLAKELSQNDKILRARLLRSTEMKSALENLASIAGYQLDKASESLDSSLTETESSFNTTNNLSESVSLNLAKNITSYTKYINLAFNEIEAMLAFDKQTLVEIIRRIKSNQLKLDELSQLRLKVADSLTKLSQFETRLKSIMRRDEQIASSVKQLEIEMDKSSSNDNSQS